MNYENLINLIERDQTGIAKGYSVCFLRSEIDTQEQFLNLIKKDLELFGKIESDLLEKEEPSYGDFVEYEDGEFARISNLRGQLQLSNKVGVYVSENGCSQASGCIWDPELDHIDRSRLKTSNLLMTHEVRKGRCWTFSEGYAGRDRGVYFEINFKIWKLKETK